MIEVLEAFIVAGLLSYILTLVLTKFANTSKYLHKYNERIFKEENASRLGGISVFVSIFISMLFIYFVISNTIFLELDKIVSLPLLIIAILIIFLLGLYDDIFGSNVLSKILIQIVAAAIVYFGGLKIAEISVPFIGSKNLNFFLSFLLTIIWICGITNAVNIIDGINGLAAGISFFALLSLGVLAFLSSQFFLVVIVAVLLGVLTGFYPFNFPRAKIYLGDSGSLVIGFILAALSMATIQRKASIAIVLLIPIIILFLPILETIVTIIRRIHEGKNIFKRDTDHLHYRFLKKGFSETKTTLILTFISFLFSLSGILFEYVRTELRVLLLLSIFLICFFLLKYLGYIRINSRSKRDSNGE